MPTESQFGYGFGALRSGQLTVETEFLPFFRRRIQPPCSLHKMSAVSWKMAEVCGLEHGRNRDLYSAVEKIQVQRRCQTSLPTTIPYLPRMVTATDGEDRDVRGHPRSKVKVKVKV